MSTTATATKVYGYFNRETSRKDEPKRAQIVLYKAGAPERVGFEVVFCDTTHMTYEAVLPWQTAGEFARKRHHHVCALYWGRRPGRSAGRTLAEQRWSHRTTPSGATRYHLVGPKALAYVQLEGDEIDELLKRLSAGPYSERNEVLVTYARELAGTGVAL